MKGGGCIRAARASPRDDGRVETGPAEPDLAETGAADPGAAAMTPRQQEALDRLFRAAGPHPEFPAGVADDLRSRLEDRLADLVPRLVDQRLVVAKHTLTLVHTCEAHYLAETAAGFAWSARAAKGAVAHKAIAAPVACINVRARSVTNCKAASRSLPIDSTSRLTAESAIKMDV